MAGSGTRLGWSNDLQGGQDRAPIRAMAPSYRPWGQVELRAEK